MQKNGRFVIGGGIIVVFLVFMGYFFTQSSIGYEESLAKVKESGKTVRATGSWVKEKKYEYKNKVFSFYMKDETGNEMKVVYQGAIPNNFESATSVVVTGKFVGDVFEAKDILTKCPSKYEGSDAPPGAGHPDGITKSAN
ncbi:MAG: cytochrome c maturation protein CcmE [Ignavibacteriaceae bacterium]|nr:MAG: cytochrome c maturation protein CcmE [Ignavibacteriaceae bacterium]MBW7873917.1 cytochrome c maturation protein CcmE [Ignavibacteria bacterium]MBZ0198004.1 cytochrome c maturation protein CcmE [Ignavibacteriaceae bacterium]OQY70924.1 MAG: cytochrome C biogenesis protein [Ignavibacteriales bacterium UTCHB3]